MPGRFTPAECELWRRSCEGRDVLELGRHHGRSTAAAARDRGWRLVGRADHLAVFRGSPGREPVHR